MRYAILALVLLALPSPGHAEESPSARVKAYMAALARAKSLSEVKPYFSKEFWSYTYAPLESSSPQEQASLLAETAKDLKGFVVQGEKVTGDKAVVSIADSKGQADPLPMVKENGVWVIDLGAGPDPGENEK